MGVGGVSKWDFIWLRQPNHFKKAPKKKKKRHEIYECLYMCPHFLLYHDIHPTWRATKLGWFKLLTNFQAHNHIQPSMYCWTTSIKSVACSRPEPGGQLGLTNTLGSPKFLARTGKTLADTSSSGDEPQIRPTLWSHGKLKEDIN